MIGFERGILTISKPLCLITHRRLFSHRPRLQSCWAIPPEPSRARKPCAAILREGLQAFPNLSFELLDVMWGISSVVLYYLNQKGTKTGEFMELDANQKVSRVVANYN